MAAVITLQSSSTTGPTGHASASFQHSPSSDHQLLRPRIQQPPQIQQPPTPQPGLLSTPHSPVSSVGTLPRATVPGRDGSSCDACVRRKSRCAMNEMVNKCYSCDFHRQDCTFTLAVASHPGTADLQSKKRRLDETEPEELGSPKRLSTLPPVLAKSDPVRPPLNYILPHHQSTSHLLTPSSTYWQHSTQHIGLTTDLEPALLEFLPLDHNQEGSVAASRVRKLSDDGTFMRVVSTRSPADSPHAASLDAIESLVAPYGSTLVEKFFEHIHPTFPVLLEDSFRQSYRARSGLTPLLLSAVYALALKFVDVGPASQTMRRPDAGRLESTALRLLVESLPYASIPTIQAGLLLMQRSNLATAALTAQLVTAGFELGLHQDCSNWRMDTWEKGLRKRLAWALYMQDKWSALVHGRPSHIFSSNWMVQDLVEQDFTDAFAASAQHDDAPVGHGPLSFCHMVALTTILSDILDRFYTLQAIEEFKAAGNNRTRMILERAKPAQIRLKDWFGRLPTELKMDSGGDLFEVVTEDNARNGALHLAYFATEITLHRCIVRSLAPENADAYLSHICRSAAKTRLISAMDFVNRLRPSHLRSFWPAAARTNFALIGSFGVLLRITAPTKEEAEFYRLRLCEYRWTLSVSKKDAEFLEFALESLDNATNLDHCVPEKPGIDELMTSAAKPTTVNPPRIGAMEDSILEAPDSGLGGTSSVISGLASPATSISDESLQDCSIPPL
ncbi:putative C6 transcription factor (OTam) [Aspergillus homomorphus CBS 101889]|uniref:Nitrogen regulatory protein OTam n=1 Tax=Aspergillus homomorphus (strain CBS 101889) TaxID=1450537 RepID=A0A395HXW4_ASPHC|nr:nitrogen regulatory protein OTam [Aspergillus homomorphus CBS 101889]RAL12329.1 nitrogen regulatory protein OTam [Aspergillus homomorphus CBS 101889]